MELYGIGVALILGLFQQNEYIPGVDRGRRGNRDIQLAKEHILFFSLFEVSILKYNDLLF